MSFGPSQAEQNAQAYNSQYQAQLPAYMNQATGYINQGIGGLNQVNGGLANYINGVGNDPGKAQLSNYFGDILSGKNKGAMGVAGSSQAFSGAAQQASATGLGMAGNSFASQFGANLGGLSLQQQNMQSVADKLASTTQNPFAVLSQQAMEDAALQNGAGMGQLRSQLAAQGLDSTSGTGAAALAALQFNTNKQVADAYRQNAAQGAQFQQQGLGMAGGLYGQIGGLELQRATTQAGLGLQGYQADIQNAQRMDAVSMQNAQLGTQASLQNAQLATQVGMNNASLSTQASMGNASNQNQLLQSAMQGQMGMLNSKDQAILQAYGMQSGNFGQLLSMGGNMWGSTLGQQGQYGQMLNQNAMANAQGRGNMWGGLLQGGMGLLGTAIGGPFGGALGGMLGGLFGGGGGGGGGYNAQPMPGFGVKY